MDLNYGEKNSKDKRFKSLSEKINELQNIKLNDPNRIESLEYNINNLNNNIKKAINNYINKSNYVEKTLESLKSLYESRNLIKENNKKKIEKELELFLFEMEDKINKHKSYIIERINNDFMIIEKKIIEIIQNKKEMNKEIYQQMERLKNYAQNEISKLYSESNDLNYKNQNNLEIMQNMLNEEIIYTKNIIANNSEKIKENEKMFNRELNEQLGIVNQNINNLKKNRKKYEEEMLDQISDFMKKIKDKIT